MVVRSAQVKLDAPSQRDQVHGQFGAFKIRKSLLAVGVIQFRYSNVARKYWEGIP